MGSKDPQTIRFAVGRPQQPQSSVWRMWVNKNDVYLGARVFLGAFKVSLHQSGIWRIADVKSLQSKDTKSDRFVYSWQRPHELPLGWTPSIGILVSCVMPSEPFRSEWNEQKIVYWSEQPETGKRLLFKVLFSRPTFMEQDLRVICTSFDRLVGHLKKENGENVWLIVREESLSALELGKIHDVMAKLKIHVPQRASTKHNFQARALLVVAEDYPTSASQPTIFDIGLGQENIVSAT